MVRGDKVSSIYSQLYGTVIDVCKSPNGTESLIQVWWENNVLTWWEKKYLKVQPLNREII